MDIEITTTVKLRDGTRVAWRQILGEEAVTMEVVGEAAAIERELLSVARIVAQEVKGVVKP